MRKLKHTFDDIKNYIESHNFKIESTHYNGYQSPIELICDLGHKFTTTFNKFQQGRRCSVCAGNKKKTFEEVFQLFIDNDYIPLFESYQNSRAPLDYRCSTHSDIIQKIDYSSLRRGRGCKYCFIDRVSGSNSVRYKDGSSELQDFLRKKIASWKKDSMFNNNFKCTITGDKFDVVHHLVSFKIILNETLESLGLGCFQNISNYSEKELVLIENLLLKNHYRYPLGVCLRKDVHQEFHEIYGYGNNTPEQFYEFKKMYLERESIQNALALSI